MTKMITAFLLILNTPFVSSCSTKMGAVGYDASGRPVPIPIFSTSADVVGELTLTIDAHGQSVLDLRAPPPQIYPIQRIAILDRKQTQIIGYQEIPLVPGIYHSHSHQSFFNGLAKTFRSLSNVVGTIGAAFVGVEWAKLGELGARGR